MAFLQTKALLAKLLATENLDVRHDSTQQTASFDTKSRILTLPVLNTQSEHIYTLFVSHECSHALHTPVNWQDRIPNNVPFDFVNVIEDVRIEKSIQDIYPGLRKDFYKGYQELHDKDFFDLDGKNLSEFNLIDRINLHYKGGTHLCVPFSDEEMVLVNDVNDCNTFDEVCLVAKRITDYVNEKQPPKKDIEEQLTEEETGGESESKDEQKSSTMKTDDEPSDDADKESNSSSMESDDGEKDETTSVTQQSLNEKMEDMSRNDVENRYDYVNVTDVNLNDVVWNISHIREDIESQYIWAHGMEQFEEYLHNSKRDVNYMVQQFEMKKSADAYARQQIHKTGVLNTAILHNYKLTDDLFLRQSVVPDGKNHGMVMLLDLSGSMSGNTTKTVKQILTLVQFCRKIQIPFEVYTFTTGGTKLPIEPVVDEISYYDTMLVNVLTSTAKPQQLNIDMRNLYLQALYCDGYNLSNCSSVLTMGGTPLNNVLTLVPQLIEKFKQETKAQKVSFVCITDGESSPISYYQEYKKWDGTSRIKSTFQYYKTTMLRYRGKVHAIDFGRTGTGMLAKWVEDHTDGVTITNIFLGGPASCKNYLSQYDIEMDPNFGKNDGSTHHTTEFWQTIAVLSPKGFKDGTDEMDVESGATKAKIKAALKKQLKNKTSSKVILSKLVDQFC